MPAKGKQKTPKTRKATKEITAPQVRHDTGTKEGPASPGSTTQSVGHLAAEVTRLTREVEAIKLELRRRPATGVAGGEEWGARRDHDKVIADRLARLDGKVDAVWNRLADFEERMEGEGARHRHDADEFDEAPEKDYDER